MHCLGDKQPVERVPVMERKLLDGQSMRNRDRKGKEAILCQSLFEIIRHLELSEALLDVSVLRTTH
jgi:hypothetical protein